MKERKKKILEIIIRDYINTAEPVGSRTLSKRYDLKISPATIRNEMADLEDMGYLTQTHTSSGRIPTQKAYRYYVDEVMQIHKLTEIMRRDIHRGYLKNKKEISNTISHTANVLSSLTNYTSVVLAPKITSFNCKHVQIVPLIRNRALLICVTREGIAKNIEMSLSVEITTEQALKISAVLNAFLQNMNFSELNVKFLDHIKELTVEESILIQEILPQLKRALIGDESEVHAEGLSNLFKHPEFNDVEKAKQVIRLVEQKPLLARILQNEDDQQMIKISIGDENDDENLKEFSIITTTYEVGGTPIGAFGIIGPTRMNYSNVTSVLDYLRKELNVNLKKILLE